MSAATRLHPDDLAELARLVAANVIAEFADTPTAAPAPTPVLIDAAEAARITGLKRGTVYRKARELGGMKVGNSPNAPWRFDRERLLAAMDACSAGRESPAADRLQRRRSRRRAPATTASGFPLLPIKGLE